MSAAGDGRLQATAAENGLLSSAPASRLSLLPEDSSSQAPGSAVGVHCGCVNGDSQSWLGTEKEDSGSSLLQGLMTPPVFPVSGAGGREGKAGVASRKTCPSPNFTEEVTSGNKKGKRAVSQEGASDTV